MAKKAKILVVDDEQTMRDFLTASMRGRYEVADAADGKAAMKLLREGTWDLVLSDVRMPGGDGLTLLDDIERELDSPPDVVIMTAFGTIAEAVEATRRGALDYLTKPFGMEQLDHVLGKALELRTLRAENRTLRKRASEQRRCRGLIGISSEMRDLRELIETIADSRGTVLLQGESGTGKEVAARAIHLASPRVDGPFIRINCAAIPETLLESELFGYERGAFTGAVAGRQGKFELADGGTLLLDEISEMPFAMQAKLLRVLQEREFMRLGAKYATRADVRIIATTNRNLRKEIREGNFREDLYFRLNVIPVHVPPLRRHKDDIPGLALHFCETICAENDKAILTIAEATMQRLMAFDWPGNVRQLQNVIERAVILSGGDELDERLLGLGEEMDVGDEGMEIPGEMTLKDMERELIMRKLDATSGNRTQAARELGISVRTLRNKLHLYSDMGLQIPT